MTAEPICNMEAEQAVLGACLIDPDALEWCRASLAADDFYREQHRRIYRALLAVATRGERVDFVTASEQLHRTSDLDAVGGMAYLADLGNGVPGTTATSHYAAIIADKSRLRRLESTARQIAALVREPDAEGDAATAEAERLLAEARANGLWQPSAAWVGDVVDTRWTQHMDPTTRPEGLQTGLRDLDAMLGGLRPGEMIVVAGRPSMGKTALALHIARHATRRMAGDAPVLLYSLETSREAIADRLIAMETGLRLDLLRQKAYGRATLERHQAEVDELMATRLWVSDKRGVTTDQIAAEAWRMRRHGMGLLVIDYLTLLADKRERGRSDSAHVGEISRRLQQLAGQLQVPVIVLSQLNRDVERREDKRPTMADLRDSGQVEQDAHVVILLHRPEQYGKEPKGVTELIVAKQKDGPVGTVRVAYRPWCGQFADLAQREATA